MSWNGLLAEVFFGSITGFNMANIFICLLAGAIVIPVSQIVALGAAQVIATIWFVKTH